MTTTAKAPRKSGPGNQPRRPRMSASMEVGTALVPRNLAPIEGLVIGGEPRVHLLPPQVLINRRGKVIRRRLGFGVIVVVVLVAAGFGVASLTLANSQANLLTAQSQTSSILQEQWFSRPTWGEVGPPLHLPWPSIPKATSTSPDL